MIFLTKVWLIRKHTFMSAKLCPKLSIRGRKELPLKRVREKRWQKLYRNGFYMFEAFNNALQFLTSYPIDLWQQNEFLYTAWPIKFRIDVWAHYCFTSIKQDGHGPYRSSERQFQSMNTFEWSLFIKLHKGVLCLKLVQWFWRRFLNFVFSILRYHITLEKGRGSSF